MALTLIGTFTPSGYAQFSTALINPNPTNNIVAIAVPTAIALPAGSSPATVLISNLGPEPAILTITTAAATTTGTASSGSTSLTVASASGITLGQVVVGVGIQMGTTVAAIAGSVITLTLPATAPLVSATVNFIAAVTLSTGIAAIPSVPLALNYVSSGFICALCLNGSSKSILNIAVGV